MRPGKKIKPLAGEWAEKVVTTIRISTADMGYPLAVIAAGDARCYAVQLIEKIFVINLKKVTYELINT
jgi:hypothetical protein